MKKHRIGKGLPRCIGSDNNGYERLCKTLEVNRDLRKFLLKHFAPAKSKSRSRLKAGERDREQLFELYSEPGFRLELWHDLFEEVKTSEEEASPEKSPIPSLEYNILSEYIKDFFQEENTFDINDVFADCPDILNDLSDDIPWTDFAGYVWLEALEGIDRWDSLDDAERIQTTLIIFAVATIVDDYRILHSAIEKAPELEAEFKSVLSGGSYVETNEDSKDKKDVVSEWNELCKTLGTLAVEAEGPSPNVDTLEQIKGIVVELDKIEQSVREQHAATSFEQLLERVQQMINELIADAAFLWLDDGVRKQLVDNWQAAKKSLSTDQVKEEFERIGETLPEVSECVRKLSVSVSDAIQRRDDLQAEEPSGFNQRYIWDEKLDGMNAEVLRLRGEQRNAQVELLSALTPFGEAFASDHVGIADSPNDNEPDLAESDVPLEPVDINNKQPEELSDTEGDVDPSEQSPTTGDICQEDNPESDTKAKESEIDKTSESEKIDIEQTESDPIANSRKELARTRVADALFESPPRIAYVVQVSRLLNRLGLNTDLPPVELFESMLLSDHLQSPDAAVAFQLKQVLEEFPTLEEFTGSPDRDLFVMLILAGTIRPALLAPQSGALAFLTDIKPSERLGAVYQLAKVIIEGGAKLQGVRIDSSILIGADSKTDWENKREQLKLDVGEWKKQAKHKTIKYAPATKVWQHWLKSGGVIHQLLLPVDSDNNGNVSAIRNRVFELADRKSFEALVKKTDRAKIGRRKGEDIHSGALNQLYGLTQEAVELAQRHLSLNGSTPSQSDFLTNTLADIRDKFEKLEQPALAELDSFVDEGKSLLSGSANSAIYAIKRFQKVLTTGYPDGDQELDPHEIVGSGLLGFSSIHIDDEGMPEGEVEQALDTLLSDQPEKYEAAFKKYLAMGDMKTAKRIADWIEYEDTSDTEDIQNRYDEVLTAETQNLHRLINETRQKVETSLGLGSITDADRTDFDAHLVQLEHRLEQSEVLRFDLERDKLKGIDETINNSLISRRGELKHLLDSLSLPPENTEYMQIARSVEQGDFVTANELIDRVRNNESFPVEVKPSQKRQVFQEFYPERAGEIDKALEALRNPKEIIEKIGKSNKFAGMLIGDIPGAQRDSAMRMLSAWYDLKRAGRLVQEKKGNITKLFRELGFLVRDVAITRPGQNFGEANIETNPLQVRELCPIPAFGSSTKGRYRLVFLWGSPTEEDIIQHADDSSVKQATIVLYFGRLSAARREGLSRISRERSRTLLVIDELLLVFLCGERDSRMFPLFSCAIPFTYVRPYVTTAGSLPPEMFYGREQEIREIADRNGAVFIYGGRQLGKTALLRAVERTSHQPKEGNYAVFIDLKGAGIGYDRDAAEIWCVIWRRLREQSVIPDEVKEPTAQKGRVHTFMDYLCRHFSESSDNSLFILLDEADRFLEVDARDSGVSSEGFHETSRLKSLMDRTGRSIKVVFAGLHNVLRTVRGENHPLGHFGEPIEVGPLLSRRGRQSAEELIRQPLLMSGYRFKEDSLVTRILAQTNYYPSLIQLYGSALIKEMRDKQISGAPLYEIDDTILAQTYQNTNLRELIRQRFHLTLQLDSRYEVIAYAIANDCIEDEAILAKGIDQRRIDDAVRGWWPEGFQDIEPYTNSLRVLLDEMVGLGVLRVIDEQNGRYTLRNPNVLLLMGTENEIVENLIRDRELPQEFEREYFRARHPKKSEHDPARSPLTFQQEDILRADRNGVSLICGIPASGLNDVIPFLQARGGGDSVIELNGLNEQREFVKALKDQCDNRPDGTKICVISDKVPWSEQWIQSAMNQVDKLTAKGRYIQIVFMADPEHLWGLQPELKSLTHKGLRWISLLPFREGFLRQWMDDVGIRDDKTERERIVGMTGGWKILLERLYNLHRGTGKLDKSFEELENEFTIDEPPSLRGDFALDISGPIKTLQLLHECAGENETTTEDLMEFMELLDDDNIDSNVLEASLEWAETLHLVNRKGKNAWQLDSVVARILS
ncbi:MAG: hypothetical protein OXI88_06800 [Gammaproteobacteria bacterium]|nr:hypothetical protein [Gammaproteobacteria bacterium]